MSDPVIPTIESPPPAASPPPTPASRRTQAATLMLLIAVAGLIGWRWYADNRGTRPTDLHRDLTHRVDLNRATRSDLMQIPGVGAGMADRIVAYREGQGRFKQVEDLAGVNGIGDATLHKLRPWVSVDGIDDEPPKVEPERLTRKPATPSKSKPASPARVVNLNEASIEELDGLPGIGPVLAQRIIVERQKRPFAKVEDLRRVSGIGPKKLEALRDLVTVGN
jgi:competence protein ComEA